ncbi:MAG TPA: hypothetical protein VFT22_00800 [Kofleriaceae bacterium]|nr:hypothetical protein [Kofleriaceae bacterium]
MSCSNRFDGGAGGCGSSIGFPGGLPGELPGGLPGELPSGVPGGSGVSAAAARVLGVGMLRVV